MTRIAVYGTLRRGFGNYQYLLSDQVFISQEVVNLPLKMVSLGGFPGLVPSDENHDSVIEIFEIDEEALRSVDGLEGYPGWYSRKEIDTSHGKAWVYFFAEGYRDNIEVPNGDWKEFINTKRITRNEVFSKD